MKDKAKTGDDQVRRFEQLKKRHQELETERIKLEERVQNQQRALDLLRQEAEREFGTSDPEALRAMLEKIERENDAKITAFAAHLDEIRAGLEILEDGGEGA